MKSSWKWILAPALLVSMLPTAALASQPAPSAPAAVKREVGVPDEASLRKIAFFPAGDGAGYVKYLTLEGSSPWGPQALGTHPNGTVYVLDSVQRQVYAVDKQGKIEAFTLEKSWYPKDIYVAANSLYVLDDDNWIRVYSLEGKLEREVMLPEGLATHNVLRLTAHPSGQVSLWVDNYQELFLDTLPKKFTPAESPRQVSDALKGVSAPNGKKIYGELGDDTFATIQSTDGKVNIKLEGKRLFGSAKLTAFDKQDNLYVVMEDLYPNGERLGVELTARRYNQNGEMTGVVRLPNEEFAMYPKRSVEVTPNGKVYAMTPMADGLSVYEVTMGRGYQSRITPPAEQGAIVDDGAEANVGIMALATRRDIRVRAITMNTTTWTWKNRFDFLTGGTARANLVPYPPKPIQLQSKPEGTVITGIPYTWGGFDSPWSKTDGQPWTNWAGATSWTGTANGPLVGNAPGPSDTEQYYAGSAGVDCSGYIAAASGNTYATKPGTVHMPTTGYDFKGSRTMFDSIWYLQPMNFLGNSAHVWYYEFRLRDGTGLSTFESTTSGDPQGAKRYKKDWSEAQGAAYHRSWFAQTTGDGPDVARTTKGAYSGTNVVGTSVWYKFTTTGATTVSLTGLTNGDADLHVYSSTLAVSGSSTNTGSTSESVYLSAGGTYYARVHVYTDNGNSVSWSINW